MDSAFLSSVPAALDHFEVDEGKGLSDHQAQSATEKYGRNGTTHHRVLSCGNLILTHSFIVLTEDPPTPLWQLVLEQFKDQLVIILLGSAAISFVLALFEDGEGWTAFVDPAVVSDKR